MTKRNPFPLPLADYAEVLSGANVIEGDLASRLARYFKEAPQFSGYLSLLHEIIQDAGIEESTADAYYVAALLQGAVECLKAGENFCPHPDPQEEAWMLSNGNTFSLEEIKEVLCLVAAREERGEQGLGDVRAKLVGMLLKHHGTDQREESTV